MQEMQVQSLGQEDPLEKEMAAHPSILAWKFPWMEEPDGLQSMGSQKNWRQLVTKQQQTTGNNQEGLSFSIRGDTSEFVGYFAGQYTSYILVQNGYSNRENHL